MFLMCSSQNGSHLSNGKLSQASFTSELPAASPTNGYLSSSHWQAKHASEASIGSYASGKNSGGVFSPKFLTRICCYRPVYYGKPLEDTDNPDGSVGKWSSILPYLTHRKSEKAAEKEVLGFGYS